jgi:DNA polymerase (family 10)
MGREEIVQILEEMADLLELKGENPFRVRAYRNGARALLNLSADLEQLVENEGLIEIKGIGEHLAKSIALLVKKGHLPDYEKLKASVPKNLLKLLNVQGLGPKKVQQLYKNLHVHSISSLKKATKEGKIAKLKGFGKKTEQNILDALEQKEIYQSRRLWWDAMLLAEPILEEIKKLKSVKQSQIAGSLRRKLETIGDLDFLASSSSPKAVMNWFTTQSFVKKIISKGDTKSSIFLKDGIQADLRVVPNSQYAFALHYFTGSKEHNIALRERASKRGWSLSEYGIEQVVKGVVAPKGSIDSEEKLFKLFGLSYIPPELRENMGEFEAAAKNKIPKLIELKELRGALHNHTTASDGRSSLKEMIKAAEDLNWEYIGITDHSKSSFQANGLSEERILEQIEEIRTINRKSKIRVFAGLECDILANGDLDFSDSFLKKLDYLVVSIHSSFQLDEKKMTKRLIKAIEHPSSTIIGHLTGRLLLKRKGYALNVPKVIDACIANKKIVELNGNPQRLDMDWRYWHAAVDKGLLCCINPDAHDTDQLRFVEAGIQIARKGWLKKKHVINSLPLKKIEELLKKMHP